MKPVTARESALRVLMSIRNASAWSDAALKAQLERDRISGAEAALATRLVYGVTKQEPLCLPNFGPSAAGCSCRM